MLIFFKKIVKTRRRKTGMLFIEKRRQDVSFLKRATICMHGQTEANNEVMFHQWMSEKVVFKTKGEKWATHTLYPITNLELSFSFKPMSSGKIFG
jgi:hypothetical protein